MTDRNDAQGAGLYSHRNGESQPPTKVGEYWLQGEMRFVGYVSQVGYIVSVKEDYYHDGYEHWLVYTEESRILLTDVSGRWWGPVLPPWDDAPQMLDLLAHFAPYIEYPGAKK